MQVHQMAEHYERLLQKAKDELFMFREKLDGTCQKLLRTERQYVCCKNVKFITMQPWKDGKAYSG